MRASKQTRYSTLSFTDKVTAMAGWLADKKARDILAVDVSRENSLSEAVIVATATSVRHAQGLAEHLLQAGRDANYEFLRMEGNVVGQWILLDFNDIIVHIQQSDTRDLFRLDDLWPSAPVLVDTRKEA